MPIAIILIVGFVLYGNVNNQDKDILKKKAVEVIANNVSKNKPILEELKSTTKEPEPIKEEVKVVEPKKNYFKIVLYIIAGVLAVLTGMYFFSNRRRGIVDNNIDDNSANNLEEKNISETQEQQPIVEEIQPDTQEQQPIVEEIQPDTQEQELVEEETKSETTKQNSREEDENNNK